MTQDSRLQNVVINKNIWNILCLSIHTNSFGMNMYLHIFIIISIVKLVVVVITIMSLSPLL